MKSVIRTMLILILLLVAAAGGGAWYIWNGMQPVDSTEPAVTISIDKGMGSSAIADLLEKNGIIRNSLFFKGYLKWTKEGSRFKAGTYLVNPGETYDNLITRLNAGDVVKKETVVFTIPEGFIAEQVVDKLKDAWQVDSDVFLQLVNSGMDLKVPDVLDIPEDSQILHRLEGYLFPDTYEIVKESTAQEVVEVMLVQMEKKLNTIPDFQQRLQERGLSLHELLTVASLVEREVVVDSERSLVAGIIYNRLEQSKRLEIDATVQYVLDEPKERLFNKDLKVDSPYNTYQNLGLPPGPICNPGLAAIEAALSPKASDFLFYVTKKDGSQAHLFAKTYEEHLANIKKSNQ